MGALTGGIGGLLLPVLGAVAVAGLMWVGLSASAAMFITLGTFTTIGVLLGIHQLQTARTTREKVAAALGIVLALVAFGLGARAIYGVPQPGPPNFAADVQLDGHGGWFVQNGFTTVPEGTTVTVPTGIGRSITTRFGNAIASGDDLTPFFADMEGAVTYPAGSRIPNLTLGPPDGLTPIPGATNVPQLTTLSNLLQPNQGNVMWNACCNIMY